MTGEEFKDFNMSTPMTKAMRESVIEEAHRLTMEEGNIVSASDVMRRAVVHYLSRGKA